MLLALFGLIVTAVPLLSQLLGVPVICGPFTDCNRVLTDPASRIAGVPIAFFGVVVFATTLILSTQVGRSRRIVSILLGLSLGTFVISGLLQWAVYRRLGLACPWCLGAAAAAVMLAVTAGRDAVARSHPAPRLEAGATQKNVRYLPSARRWMSSASSIAW
jgi:uncharacterized membrane protein